MRRKKSSMLQRIYGDSDSFSRILAINFLIIFLAWPFLSNVAAILSFYIIVYPLSLVLSYNPSFFFDVVFTAIYWPWTIYPVSVPLIFVLSYLVRKKTIEKGKAKRTQIKES